MGVDLHSPGGALAAGCSGGWLGWPCLRGMGGSAQPGGCSGQPGWRTAVPVAMDKATEAAFLDSRVEGGRALVQAIQAASPRPRVFMQASGVNYYGPRGLELVTEADGPGNDFLARLCQAWEASTQAVEKLGVRRVILRSAIVLSTQAGILPVMLFPLKWFVGGRLGSGKQGLA